MRWEDERYIKIYTRDEPEWAAVSWQAKGMFYELNRKCDRAGILKLGKLGLRALVTILRAKSWEEIEPFVTELLADGCIQDRGAYLIIPNHVPAQEARASASSRKRDERERDRDVALATEIVKETAPASRDVTRGHAESRDVTIQKSPSQLSPAHHRQEEDLAQSVFRTLAPATPLASYLEATWPKKFADRAKTLERESAWHEAAPGVDLLAEAKKARAWELANPTRVKTQKAAFLGRWYSRAQDDVGRGRNGAAPRNGVARGVAPPSDWSDPKAKTEVPF